MTSDLFVTSLDRTEVRKQQPPQGFQILVKKTIHPPPKIVMQISSKAVHPAARQARRNAMLRSIRVSVSKWQSVYCAAVSLNSCFSFHFIVAPLKNEMTIQKYLHCHLYFQRYEVHSGATKFGLHSDELFRFWNHFLRG